MEIFLTRLQATVILGKDGEERRVGVESNSSLTTYLS